MLLFQILLPFGLALAIKNKVNRKPDFYLDETDERLVFSRNLDGLIVEEIKENKPELKDLIDKISPIINK